MSSPNTILSAENMQTIVAVAFVLALLSLAFNFFNFNQTTSISVVALANHRAMQNHSANIADLTMKIEALEADAKKRAAAPPPAAPAPVEVEADATAAPK